MITWQHEGETKPASPPIFQSTTLIYRQCAVTPKAHRNWAAWYATLCSHTMHSWTLSKNMSLPVGRKVWNLDPSEKAVAVLVRHFTTQKNTRSVPVSIARFWEEELGRGMLKISCLPSYPTPIFICRNVGGSGPGIPGIARRRDPERRTLGERGIGSVGEASEMY